jgi:hypothetical protein
MRNTDIILDVNFSVTEVHVTQAFALHSLLKGQYII